MAYVRSLEDEVEQLRNQLKSFKTQAWVNKSAHTEEKKILPATSPNASVGSSSRQSDHGWNNILPMRSPRGSKWEADISVDERGSITFHGSTSAVHEPVKLEQNSRMTPQHALSPESQQEDEDTKQVLRQNAQHQRQLEEFAIANAAPRINLPKEVSEELLRFHWCWIHPLFAFVYRPAFTRGMTLVSSQPGAPEPPYFSETLLKVMTSHCARFLNHDVYQQHFNMTVSSSDFMQQVTHDARVSLAMESLNTSSIPTIQALLQQSAREIVFGRSSQAWLYGGMAFRMAFDMGIHLPSDKLQSFVKSLSSEDIEIRKRLFWSCYTWDKVLSLYLGRMPAFTPLTDEVPLTFLDDFTDTDPWIPYYGETPDTTARALPQYPPTPGYIVSCFQSLSKLCIIINDLMQEIYSAEATAQRAEEAAESGDKADEPFIRISRRLNEWWNSLPLHLQVNMSDLPKVARPIHIMSLNLLYHTIVILLHRPVMLSVSNTLHQASHQSYTTCLHATVAIHDLLVLQANTFGLGQISYLNAYCAYMAATISVLRFERELTPNEDHNITSERIGLEYLLDVIERSAKAMPGLERSNAIIRKRMKGVVNAHLSAHSTFSPNTIIQQSNAVGPSSEQMALAQATAFQQMSNPGLGHVFDPANELGLQSSHSHDSSTASVPSLVTDASSIQYTSVTSTDLADNQLPMPAFVDDFLPAFPGQQFPVGSEYYFGSNVFDANARMSLMGYNLDPHPKLDPGAIDWTLMQGYGVPNHVNQNMSPPGFIPDRKPG